MTIISVFNSYEVIDSLDFLWLRVPILALPLAILNIRGIEQKDITNIARGYLAFSLLATTITLFYAVKIYFEYGLLLDPDLTSEYITPIQHPYYGIFTLIAIVTLYTFDRAIKQQKIRVFLMIFFSVGVILSTSRMAVLLLFLFWIYVIISRFKNKKGYRFLVIGGLGVVMLFSILNTVLKTKITNTLTYWDSPRAWLWNNSYKILKYSNHKVIGTGIGDFYRVKRSPKKFVHSQRGIYGYNPHNQYLEFLITNGVFGLLYLFAMLFLLYLCYKAKLLYSFIIIFIIALFSFTECIFNRQFGIQLYAFFLPISIVLATRKQSNI
ncbi:O-antigen ligase family protein [Yeosuana marina]|uniref:O-antigen ligase family protein n=1 Tax=Yeosuana marina TaxID=1565536 RepID=UPI001422F95D|nr:O-antigen ligase family protein [Yeosuana marina]